MRSYYSVQSPYNPVYRHVTSRFPGHLSAICETATGPSKNGRHNRDSGYPLLGAPLLYPLPPHPSSTHRAAV